MPDALNNLVVLTRGGINLKTVTSTVIDVTEDGTRSFSPLICTLTVTAATAITVGCQYSIGSNATNYDNVIPTVTGPTSLNTVRTDMNSGGLGVIAANTEIRIKITTAATGTSETGRVDIIGYYV